MESGQMRWPQSVTCFLVSFLDSFLFILMLLSVLVMESRLRFMPLFVTELHKNNSYFFQQPSYAFYGGILLGGDILKIKTVGFHPYNVHLLFGNAFGQVV